MICRLAPVRHFASDRELWVLCGHPDGDGEFFKAIRSGVSPVARQLVSRIVMKCGAAFEVRDANTQITRVTVCKAVDPEICGRLGAIGDLESALNCLRFLRGRSETAGSQLCDRTGHCLRFLRGRSETAGWQLGDRTGIGVFDRSTG